MRRWFPGEATVIAARYRADQSRRARERHQALSLAVERTVRDVLSLGLTPTPARVQGLLAPGLLRNAVLLDRLVREARQRVEQG